jgi:hypothetical protein
MPCSSWLDIDLRFRLGCSSTGLSLGLDLRLPRILFLRGRLFCEMAAIELELGEKRGEDLRS